MEDLAVQGIQKRKEVERPRKAMRVSVVSSGQHCCQMPGSPWQTPVHSAEEEACPSAREVSLGAPRGMRVQM